MHRKWSLFAKYATFAYFFFILSALYNEDDCRMMRFGHYEIGISLVGHVIAKIKVLDKDICKLKCYYNDDCVSYNFGPSETGDDICELNNSTDRRHLKRRESFVFQGTEVRYIIQLLI